MAIRPAPQNQSQERQHYLKYPAHAFQPAFNQDHSMRAASNAMQRVRSAGSFDSLNQGVRTPSPQGLNRLVHESMRVRPITLPQRLNSPPGAGQYGPYFGGQVRSPSPLSQRSSSTSPISHSANRASPASQIRSSSPFPERASSPSPISSSTNRASPGSQARSLSPLPQRASSPSPIPTFTNRPSPASQARSLSPFPQRSSPNSPLSANRLSPVRQVRYLEPLPQRSSSAPPIASSTNKASLGRQARHLNAQRWQIALLDKSTDTHLILRPSPRQKKVQFSLNSPSSSTKKETSVAGRARSPSPTPPSREVKDPLSNKRSPSNFEINRDNLGLYAIEESVPQKPLTGTPILSRRMSIPYTKPYNAGQEEVAVVPTLDPEDKGSKWCCF